MLQLRNLLLACMHEWQHMVFVFLRLTYFIYMMSIQVHPCYCKWQGFLLCYTGNNIPLWMYTTFALLIRSCIHRWTHCSPLCLMPGLGLLWIMLPETWTCRYLFNAMPCSSGGLALRVSQFSLSAWVSTVTAPEAGSRLVPLFTVGIAGIVQRSVTNLWKQLQHGYWGWLTDSAAADMGISNQIFQRQNSFF